MIERLRKPIRWLARPLVGYLAWRRKIHSLRRRDPYLYK
jgi:hypothetical protein